MPPKVTSVPSWILPGRVINPVMKHKVILETSLAFSRTFNSRNIEFHWYAMWVQTLSDLVADVPNLVVAPQFPIWFVPTHDVDETEDDGDDPEEIIGWLPVEQDDPVNEADDDEVGYGAGDVSFASTVPEKDAHQVVVDFAILHLMAVAQPQRNLKDRYGGWRITEANIGLLVEVKRFASRSLKAEEQEADIGAQISEACSDLIRQAAHVFIQDSNKEYLFAIAASGNCPYHLSAVYVITVMLQVHTGAALQFTAPKCLAPCIFLPIRTPVFNLLRKNQPAASRSGIESFALITQTL
jgi:hypothetical protein